MTEAAVVVNEIAWMGTETSANHEWIELYNSGDAAVNLEGWHLEAEDGSPTVALLGTIAAKDYFLLERTSDESVPGTTADHIYTGSLGNAGETLILSDANGSVIDRVRGGENWELGGDNETKATLQRASSGWVTAEATPGRVNATQSQVVSEEQSSTETTTSSQTKRVTNTLRTGSHEERIQLHDEDPALSLTLILPDTLERNVPHTFSVRAYDEDGDRLSAGVSYQWNFGDGTTAKGSEVRHVYRYSGSYVVTVESKTVRFREELKALAQAAVTVDEPSVSIVSVTADSVVLKNDKDARVEISGWHVTIGDKVETLPPHTYLLPDTTTTIVRRTKGLSERLALYSPTGYQVWSKETPAVTAASRSASRPNLQVPAAVARRTVESNGAPQATSGFAAITLPPVGANGSAADDTQNGMALAALRGVDGGETTTFDFWLWGMVGVVGIALLSLWQPGGLKETPGEAPLELAAAPGGSETLPPATAFTIIEETDPVADRVKAS